MIDPWQGLTLLCSGIKHQITAALFTVAVLLTGCVSFQLGAPSAFVILSAQPLTVDSQSCTDAFVAHRLPHTTRSDKKELVHFIANGAGVALADLNDDSMIDIVLAGMDAQPTIMWNQGGLKFRNEILDVAGQTTF